MVGHMYALSLLMHMHIQYCSVTNTHNCSFLACKIMRVSCLLLFPVFMVSMLLTYRRAAEVVKDRSNDVAKLFAFFTECKLQNPQFYSDFQLDKEGKIQSIFWSSASMQGEYADFGDAVTFDTTHKTNLYDKPLAMFVGANHHLQCTIFGFALLGDETIETFEWVFSTFKRCMDGVAPKCILTGIAFL